MKKYIMPFCIVLATVLVDRFSKLWILGNMILGEFRPLIPGVLDLHYLHNNDGAMGLFQGGLIPLVIVTTVMIGGCLWYLFSPKHVKSTVLAIGLSLIIGGGIGNLLDRVFFGLVIDFVAFPIPWFSYSFNIADVAICVGAGFLVLDLILDIIRGSKKKNKPTEETVEE